MFQGERSLKLIGYKNEYSQDEGVIIYLIGINVKISFRYSLHPFKVIYGK